MKSVVDQSDDTIRVTPKRRPPNRGRTGLLAAAAGGSAMVLAAVWLLWPSHRAVQVSAVPAPAAVTAQGSGSAGGVPRQAEFAVRTATAEQILADQPGGLTVFRLAENPKIVVLDFASLREQGLMLNRVAALIEKAKLPHDRLLSDGELDQAIRASGSTVENFYYGHDYGAPALVRFFALAAQERIKLTPQEAELHRLLRQLGWFSSGASGGLISIPRVGADEHVTRAARAAILHHELSHGEYFSNPAYVAFVHQFWRSMLTAEERSRVRSFLGADGYDTALDDVMENEAQAYLMFTHDPDFFAPGMIGMQPARLLELQRDFLRQMPQGWLRNALGAWLASAPVARAD